MFETAWQEHFATEGRRTASLSLAAVLHLGALVIVVLASLLAVKQVVVEPPSLDPIFVIVAPPPEPGPEGPPPGREPQRVAAPSAPAGDRAQDPEIPPEPVALPDPPLEPAQPDAVPDSIEQSAVDALAGDAASDGDRDGEGDGDGTGNGGDGTDPDGDGRGDDPGPDSTGGGDGTGGPYQVGGSVVPPVIVHKVKPLYPEFARVARMQGSVSLRAIIGANGEVRDVVVVSSSNRMFEAAAVEAVREWKYRPATFRGVPVAVYFGVTVEFTLR